MIAKQLIELMATGYVIHDSLIESLFWKGSHDTSIEDVDGEPFVIKHSSKSLYDSHDMANLHILIEYLAYQIMALYPNVHIPDKVRLKFDKARSRIGLHTSLVKGIDPERVMEKADVARLARSGYYVFALIACWDVKPKNMVYDTQAKKMVLLDPGGSMTFRAEGKRKEDKFSDHASEVHTFRNPQHVAGRLYQHLNDDDMQQAKTDFISVKWEDIRARVTQTEKHVTLQLKHHDFEELIPLWEEDIRLILSKLQSRHRYILNHIST